MVIVRSAIYLGADPVHIAAFTRTTVPDDDHVGGYSGRSGQRL